MKFLKKATLFLLLVSGYATVQAETKCDIERPVVFAGFDWDSATLHNGIARFILEKGYGCKTDEIPGTTLPLFNGMLRGDVDVAMEIWKQSVAQAWADGLAAGKFIELGINFNDAIQGIYIPKYLVEGDDAPAPDLTSVDKLAKYKLLFKDKEEPEKGRFYNCVLGWSCEKLNSKKMVAYGIEDDFVNFRPGAGAAIPSAVESAILRKKPILFYYWTPSWLIGRFGDQLIRLEEPAYEPETWKAFMESDNPEKATAYPLTKVAIGVTTKFMDESQVVTEFLKQYSTDSASVSKSLDYMQVEKAKPEEAAAHFLKNNPEMWQKWVPADVAEKVKAAL